MTIENTVPMMENKSVKFEKRVLMAKGGTSTPHHFYEIVSVIFSASREVATPYNVCNLSCPWKWCGVDPIIPKKISST